MTEAEQNADFEMDNITEKVDESVIIPKTIFQVATDAAEAMRNQIVPEGGAAESNLNATLKSVEQPNKEQIYGEQAYDENEDKPILQFNTMKKFIVDMEEKNGPPDYIQQSGVDKGKYDLNIMRNARSSGYGGNTGLRGMIDTRVNNLKMPSKTLKRQKVTIKEEERSFTNEYKKYDKEHKQ